MAKTLNILFLGAGKRLSLLESFGRAARREDVDLTMLAGEKSGQVPIASAASILIAPDFRSAAFADWLLETCRRLRVDIVVPNMDAATVALARAKEKVAATGAWAVVSSLELCEAMEDKAASEAWFVERGFRVPMRAAWPRILKRRLGFASRGQLVVSTAAERDRFLATLDDPQAYLEQDFLEGIEYSVDAYVDRHNGFLAAMPRQRLKVLDGEVDESLSRHHPEIEAETRRLFSEPGWMGPLTAQFIDTPQGAYLIEVNPRFGGGVTHAIHCGLDMPRWIIRERLDRTVPERPVQWQENSLMTRCRRDIFL